MKNLIITFLLLNSTYCFSQDTITTAMVKDYMEKEVCVVGKVVSYKLASNGKNTNYINIDKPYPDSVFTMVISNFYLEKAETTLPLQYLRSVFMKDQLLDQAKDP